MNRSAVFDHVTSARLQPSYLLREREREGEGRERDGERDMMDMSTHSFLRRRSLTKPDESSLSSGFILDAELPPAYFVLLFPPRFHLPQRDDA